MSLGPLSQPLDGLRAAFGFPRLLDRRSALLFVAYWLLAAGVVGGVAALAVAFGPDAKRALLAYLLPEHWRTAGQMLFEHLFGRLGHRVLANFILQGSMAAISISCCVLKEILSRRIEHSRHLTDGHAPWPLWRQVIEELKFALLYLVVYNLIFWLGYPPWDGARLFAQVLSYTALLVFFNLTFLCPLFLRHRIGYGRMVRTFFSRPLAAFGFAALFCAPPLIATNILVGRPIVQVVPLLLGLHVLAVAPAAAGGTWLAARLLPTARAMRPARWPGRLLFWLLALAILAGSSLVFARLADSVHRKSQVLKCRYALDWSSLDYKLPSLSDLSVGLSVDLEITNPTEVDVEIERSRLVVTNADKPFGIIHLDPIAVPAGQTRRQRLALKVEIALSRLLEYRDLLNKPWDFVLWIEIQPDWEFPVYFR